VKHALPLLGLVAALVLAGCGGGSEGSSGSGGGGSVVRTIRVKETEFALAPGRIELSKPGRYTFTAVNDGTIDHALELEGGGVEEETEHVAPGKSASVTVDLSKSGDYEIYCPIGDHRDRGMKGMVVVGGGGSGGGGGTTTNEDKGSGSYGY
jgi:plastocyanin